MNISITDDNVLEENETFNLTVRVINSLVLSRVNTGNNNQVLVAILDNDRMLTFVLYVYIFTMFYHPLAITVTFNQSSYNVNEELVAVQPVLLFSNPSQSDITIQVVSTNISASGKIKRIQYT